MFIIAATFIKLGMHIEQPKRKMIMFQKISHFLIERVIYRQRKKVEVSRNLFLKKVRGRIPISCLLDLLEENRFHH